MIDEKKIEEAANRLCDYGSIYDSGNRIEGFKEGAHWAIQEFLKDLWHPASEEPRNKAYILIVDEERDSMVDFFEPNYEDWDHEVELWDIDRWLYIDDLFTKQEGGNEK